MQRYYLTVYKCRPAVCKIGALMFKIVIRTKKAAFAPRVFMRVSGGQKYVGHNSKYVRHILKYLRHNFYLLPEGCNGVKMSFRFPWLKNGVPRPGFCGCECPHCRVAAGLPEKVRIKMRTRQMLRVRIIIYLLLSGGSVCLVGVFHFGELLVGCHNLVLELCLLFCHAGAYAFVG